MKRTWAVVILGLCIAGWGLAVAAAAEKTPAVLEAEYERENNPRKRADLAKKLMDQRREELRARIATGRLLEETSLELVRYQAALDRLASAVRAANHSGTSKSAETHLRTHINVLEGLKISVSSTERPLLDRLLSNVVQLREEVLYGLMHPAED